MDDHRVITVDAEHSDLEQVAVASRADAHREAVIKCHCAMALRTACSMSSSAIPAFEPAPRSVH